jgi:hypothetical protein
MKIFRRVREFFWPLLEKEVPPTLEEMTIESIHVNEKYLEKTLDYIIKRFEAEEDRKKVVESKSSLFIGTISVVTSVAIVVTTSLVNANGFNAPLCLLIVLLVILTIYMTRTIWFSIQALERRNYHLISVNDFIIPDKESAYYKTLIAGISNKIRKNYATINSKVDSMVLAQEYFKRAIIVVSLYAFTILLYYLSKHEVDALGRLNHFIKLINSINLNGWTLIGLSLLISLSLGLNIRAILYLKEIIHIKGEGKGKI